MSCQHAKNTHGRELIPLSSSTNICRLLLQELLLSPILFQTATQQGQSLQLRVTLCYFDCLQGCLAKESDEGFSFQPPQCLKIVPKVSFWLENGSSMFTGVWGQFLNTVISPLLFSIIMVCFIMIDGTKSLLPVVRVDQKQEEVCDLDFLIRGTNLNWVLLLLCCHLGWHLRFCAVSSTKTDSSASAPLMINELSTLHYPPSLVTDAKSAPIKDIFSLSPPPAPLPFRWGRGAKRITTSGNGCLDAVLHHNIPYHHTSNDGYYNPFPYWFRLYCTVS